MQKVEIWTDGASKGNPGPGGFGVVLVYKKSSGEICRKEIKEAYESTTNNRMELMGPIVALETLKNPCDVILTSDSQYLVKAFNEGWISKWEKEDYRRGKSDEVKNIDLWEKLIALTTIHKVKFVWVKGHNDNVENERCDKLANEAIEELQSKK